MLHCTHIDTSTVVGTIDNRYLELYGHVEQLAVVNFSHGGRHNILYVHNI